MPIQIEKEIVIHDSEIQLDFVQASGPGGQNVNKVSSAVQLRFDLNNARSMPGAIKRRLARLAGKRITKNGILIITAKRYKSQDKNRKDAIERLIRLVKKAAIYPKVHRKTVIPRSSKERRLQMKQRQSAKKSYRQTVRLPDE